MLNETTAATVRLLPGKAEAYFVQFPGAQAHAVSPSPEGLTCDCRGYEYRRDCRHVREVARLLPRADREGASVLARVRAVAGAEMPLERLSAAPEPSALPLVMPAKPKGEIFHGVRL